MYYFNIGLKSIIKPHNKLSEFCKLFVDRIYPEYRIEILEDIDYKYNYIQYFPHFEIEFLYTLERELSAESFFSDYIYISCYLKNEYLKSALFLKFIPKELNSKTLLDELNNNSFFLEFYNYQENLKKWLLLDNSYISLKRAKNNKNEVFSLYPIEFIKNGISIIPAIIKYNSDNIYSGYGVGYDLCMIISYNLDDFISEEKQFEGETLIINKIKFRTQTKEITTLILSGKFLESKNWSEKKYLTFSTEKNDDNIYDELSFGVREIVIVYTIGMKEYEKKIDINLVNKVNIIRSFYSKLNDLQKINRKWY